MRKVTVTFSIPEALNNQLHAFVEPRGLSRFVTNAIEKALSAEQKALQGAYLAAEEDPDRKEVIDDWAVLEGEDWNE